VSAAAAGLIGVSAAAAGSTAGSKLLLHSVAQETDRFLLFVRHDVDANPNERPFVRIVSSREELNRWLQDNSPALQWLQVEGLLSDREAWVLAAQGRSDTPLDVVLSEPGSEFSNLYRLVDVRAVRDVRVSIHASPAFLKAVRLAASLGLPVRLLPGQPSPEIVEELAAALAFYLHDPMVDAPIEFFHSSLAWMRRTPTASLWIILEEDPAIFQHYHHLNDGQSLCRAVMPTSEGDLDFVARHLRKLIDAGAECASCPWVELCQGYFKWPEPTYSCAGVKRLFATLQAAADEIEQDLSAYRGKIEIYHE
jgi:hypothetical protein